MPKHIAATTPNIRAHEARTINDMILNHERRQAMEDEGYEPMSWEDKEDADAY